MIIFREYCFKCKVETEHQNNIGGFRCLECGVLHPFKNQPTKTKTAIGCILATVIFTLISYAIIKVVLEIINRI